MVVVAGIWLGFAAPLFVFLLAGISAGRRPRRGFRLGLHGLMLNEGRSPPGVRPWLRGFAAGSASGVVLQSIFALAGGWSFGT